MICDSYAYICICYEIRRRNKRLCYYYVYKKKIKHYRSELLLKIIDTVIINEFLSKLTK